MADIIGVAKLDFSALQKMTLPQLRFCFEHRGRIAWPAVEAAIDAKRVETLTDDSRGDEPSPVQKALDSHARRKRGEKEVLTEKDRRYNLAFGVTYQKYLGDPERRPQDEVAVPFPGMSRAEARAILNWIQDGNYPMEAWGQLQPRIEQIELAAKLK